MHFLVLGGSGQNGILIIQEALARGHTVTAMLRNPSAYTVEASSKPTVIKGTPESLDDTEAALQTHSPPSAVIVALGLNPSSPADLLTTATRNLITALRDLGLTDKTKIVVNSSQGVGASAPSLIAPFRLLFAVWPRMRLSQAAHEEADGLLMGERSGDGLRFVVARPARLTEGEAVSVTAFGDDGKGIGSMASISRKSLAKWLVLAAEMAEWDGKAPVLAN